MPGISKPLRLEDGPIVWIDCEMTGLDYKKDRIIEIAVLITNKDLELVDDGLEFVIHTDKDVLDNMNEWCVDQHGKSGLTQACLESPHQYADVSASVLSYVKEWIPQHRAGVLAGSSVHCDKAFLAEGMPDLVEHLHYRIIDVSTVKELAQRWYPTAIEQRVRDAKSASNHRSAMAHLI
ncbi:hypothetical protein FRB98_008419 [Tulasnella sp. 332]|nr:hypothetical protein FRB98_008419 [Tulasnella sp. 332]